MDTDDAYMAWHSKLCILLEQCTTTQHVSTHGDLVLIALVLLLCMKIPLFKL